MSKALKRILKIIGITVGVIIVIPVLFILFLTIIEYKPKDTESVSINGTAAESNVPLNQEITIVTWNTGYGALGKNADYFMDGGTKVVTADKKLVQNNIEGISTVLKNQNPDIILLQEVDESSTRSHGINERKFYRTQFSNFQETFANNFKVLFIPYPIPPIGKVKSGIQTLSKYNTTESTRIKLPCPFSWPLRIGNLKRAVLVNRIKIQNSNKELVIVNVHLEAYDSGEGKIAQTKLLKSILEEEVSKGNYVIAGGDFNQSFSTTDISQYVVTDDNLWKPGLIDIADFKDFLTFQADNTVPTCRSLDKPYDKTDTKTHFQFYMLDGFMVSNNVSILKTKTLNENFEYTDHNPVELKIILEE